MLSELLYADDLVLMSVTMEGLGCRFRKKVGISEHRFDS